MEVSLRPRQRPVGSHMVTQTSEDRSESVDLLGCQAVEEQAMHQLDMTRRRRVQSPRPASVRTASVARPSVVETVRSVSDHRTPHRRCRPVLLRHSRTRRARRRRTHLLGTLATRRPSRRHRPGLRRHQGRHDRRAVHVHRPEIAGRTVRLARPTPNCRRDHAARTWAEHRRLLP